MASYMPTAQGSETVTIGHVGDSRAYRIRDGIIQRLTRDHSLVEEMRRRGQITQSEASSSRSAAR